MMVDKLFVGALKSINLEMQFLRWGFGTLKKKKISSET